MDMLPDVTLKVRVVKMNWMLISNIEEGGMCGH